MVEGVWGVCRPSFLERQNDRKISEEECLSARTLIGRLGDLISITTVPRTPMFISALAVRLHLVTNPSVTGRFWV